MIVKNLQFVYKYLVCEFDHYDFCLKGLIKIGTRYFVCINIRGRDDPEEEIYYNLYPIELDEECNEYLEDYRVAYKHWFHEGHERCQYLCWDLSWFSEKWKHRNPIIEKIKSCK